MEPGVQSPAVPTPIYSGEPLLMMTPTVVTESGSVNVSQAVSQSLTDVQRKALLKRQVEYYFSRENLNHDTYLVSQMDADQYVDISIIANFNQVKKLTSDINLLVEVLKDSICVQVDDTERKVRPLHKRCMIILREIPEDTNKEEIEEMLRHEECPPFLSCEYATGNCWYIEFQTEEQAQEAFTYLRETVRKFKGEDIKARIKAKPSTIAVPSTRQEQPRAEIPLATTVDATRPPQPLPIPSTAASTIRYPVPLHHIPLQNPSFPFAVPSPAHLPYMPSYMLPQHPLAMPPWNQIFAADSNYSYEMNSSFGYAPVQPNQSRPTPNNSGREWKGRGAATNSMSERVHEPVHTVASQSASTNTAPKNSVGSHSNYFNGRSNSDSAGFHKQNAGVQNRTRGYGDNQSMQDRNNYNIDNIPPRLRNNAQRDRSHKDKQRISGHSNHYGHTNTQTSSGSSRRSVNHQSHQRASTTAASNSANGVSHLPHNSRATAGHSPPSGHESRTERSSKEYTSRQSNTNLPHAHNRNHGAHRNSKSPDKDIELNQSHDIVKSQSFELDSSAFPALPGATTATTSTAANAITLGSTATSTLTTTAVGPLTQVAESTNDCKANAVAPNETDKGGKIESVSKLSDIVKNNIPELTKLADAAKNPKPCVNHKESLDKPVSTKHHGSNKGSGAQSYQKNRPTHLANGVHLDKPIASKGASKNIPSVHKPTEGDLGKGSDSATHQVKKESNESVRTESKAASGAQDGKISYAAITAAQPAPKPSAVQDQSPVSPTGSSGDNNNNAEGKSLPTKNDNLYSPTAAKNTSNSHPTRKGASTQNSRNGPFKPKNSDSKPASGSTPSRNPTSPHTPSSSALVAR